MPSRLIPRMASDAGSGTGAAVSENCFSRADAIPPGSTERLSSTKTLVRSAAKTSVPVGDALVTVSGVDPGTVVPPIPVKKVSTSVTGPLAPLRSNSASWIRLGAASVTKKPNKASAATVLVLGLTQPATNPIPGSGVNAGPTVTAEAGTVVVKRPAGV